MSRPPLALGIVAALLLAGSAAGSLVHGPVRAHAKAETVEVLGATAVCPDVRQIDAVYETRVSVGAAPLPAGRAASGGSILTALVHGTEPATSLPIVEPGQVAVGLGTTAKENGVVVAATGALATGLEVEQVTRVNNGRYRGLANLRCDPPKREAWFVGASSDLVNTSSLVMANVDDTPATVDITAFAKSGPLDPRLGQGVTIAPHTRYGMPLDLIAPDQNWIVLHVVSRQGRVVAAVKNIRADANIPLGFDYVPQTLPPAPTVVVPGVPKGPGFRGLVVGNPGQDDTTVAVQVTVQDGQFVPAGMDQISVPAGHSVMIPLAGLTDSSALAATVTSAGAPVVAGAVVYDIQQFQLSHLAELAYVGAARALTGPALLTDVVIDRPTESTLILTATDTAAAVVITPIKVLGAAGTPPKPRTVDIPAGRTLTFRLTSFFPAGTVARLAVEVRPEVGSGPVYATRYLKEHGARSALSTLLTLQGPAQQVSRLAVVEDDEAAYP